MGFGTTLDLFYWLRFAMLAALLGLAIFHARRRWLKDGADDMARRLLLPWLMILTGFSVYLGLLTVVIAPVWIIYVVVTVGLWVAVPAIASIMVLDLGAKLLKAERTGFWLAAAIIAYVAVTFIWLSLLGVGELLLVPGLWLEFVTLASIPAAAALIWWAYLPGAGGGSGFAGTFD